MKAVVIYHSSTGFTERYAKWIAQAAGCEAVAFEDRDRVRLSDYDAILFGSWVHAGGIRRVKWLKSRLSGMKGKRVLVFAVGAMPPGEEAQKMFAQNFSDEELRGIQTFYLQGGLNYEKMGALDRAMMWGFRKMLSKSPENAEALRAISQSYDCARLENIAPILAALKEE